MLGLVGRVGRPGLSGNVGPLLDFNFLNGAPLDSRITFSRAATGPATYFDSSGTLQQAPINLLFPSGDPSTIFTANVTTQTAQTQNAGIAPDGTNTMTRLAELASTAVHYNTKSGITVSASTQYNFSIYAKAQQDQYIQLYYDDGSNGVHCNFDLIGGTVNAVGTHGTGATAGNASITAVGNGIYRCSVSGIIGVATSARCGVVLVQSLVASFAPSYAGNASNGLLIWGAQLEAGVAPSAYIPTVGAAGGAPRFDYDPVTHVARGLLLEEARTNNVVASVPDNSANWTTSNGTSTTNSTTAPNGTNTATLWVDNVTSVQHSLNTAANFSYVSGTTYTWSVFAKASTAHWFQLYTSSSIGSFGGTFDLNNGVVGTVLAGTTASIQSVGNGWYRCSITGTSTATAASSTLFMGLTNNADTAGRGIIYPGTGLGIYVWGAQMETGAFPTSYIPTSGGSATRPNDAATISGTFPKAGSFVADFQWPSVSANAVIASLGTSSDANNTINLRFATTSPSVISNTVFVANVNVGGTNTANSYTQGNIGKAGLAYTLTTDNVCLNGGTVALGTITGLPATMNAISFDWGRLATYSSGYLRRFRFWSRALSSPELQAATT